MADAHVHILVLTDKNVAACRSLPKLQFFFCDDKPGGEPDHTLLAFLPFLNSVPRKLPSGFVFSLVSNLHQSGDFANAMALAKNLQADLIVWYSFAMPATSEATIDPEIQSAAEFALSIGKVLVYPFLSMPLLDAPGAIPVAGAAIHQSGIHDSMFTVPGAPAGILANEPRVIAAGAWPDFQRAWEQANRVISVPDPQRRVEGHALAVWTVTAVVAYSLLSLKRKGSRQLVNDVDAHLKLFSIPVALQPPQRVTYGYLDPLRIGEFGG